MSQLTHDSLHALIRTLPESVRDQYFKWRRHEAADWRLRDRRGFDYTSPQFVAHCLQKLIALQKAVDLRVASFAGPEPDSNNKRNQTHAPTEG